MSESLAFSLRRTGISGFACARAGFGTEIPLLKSIKLVTGTTDNNDIQNFTYLGSWNEESSYSNGIIQNRMKNIKKQLGELVGTALFLIFALGGTNVANSVFDPPVGGHNSQLLYISLSFGVSLAVNVWIFYRVSGGLFNPAVSLGLAIGGIITPLRAALLTISQIVGGIIGAAIIDALLPGSLNASTTLSHDMSTTRGLFLEMFLTFELMLTIFMLAAEKHKATFMAPLVIGLSLFIAELVGVCYTGGALNPVRHFGPALATKSFNRYDWIYWVGPCMGAVLSAGFYKLLKILEYETAVPGQDGDVGRQIPKRSPETEDRNQLVGGSDV